MVADRPKFGNFGMTLGTFAVAWPPGLTRGTVPMTDKKSRALELLAFDEYCRFDTSALFLRIKLASLYTKKESRSIKYSLIAKSSNVREGG